MTTRRASSATSSFATPTWWCNSATIVVGKGCQNEGSVSYPSCGGGRPNHCAPSFIDGTGTMASAAPPAFIDGASGRVLPCIALREVVKAPSAITDQISGRVFPCVALREVADAQIQVSNSPIPPSCSLPADLLAAVGPSAPSWASTVAAPARPRLRSLVVGSGLRAVPAPILHRHRPRFPSVGSAAGAGTVISTAALAIPSPSQPLASSSIGARDAVPWTEVVSRRVVALARPQAREAAMAPNALRHYRPGSAAAAASEAFKKRFGNACFRCLGSKHKSFLCKDLLTCYSCKQPGHLERGFPVHLRSKRPISSHQAEPVPPPPSPTPPSAPPPRSPPTIPVVPASFGSVPVVSAATVWAPAVGPSAPAVRRATMAYVLGDALRRHASSSCKVVGMPAMEAEAHRLRSSALVLTAVGHFSGISADTVARAVERDLRFPASDFIITPFFPEGFLLIMFQSAQRDMALELRSIIVAGV
ncbi:hypothetical protein ZWY2020_006041 [Hordeum vulgare]|nr:hypothetical protein ZWY2020_006041 [Hordeum vulgare]